MARWLRSCRHTWSSIERALSTPARTLRHWIQGWRDHRLRSRPLGRPPVRSPREARQELLEAVKEVGPTVGLQPLSARFPDLPRREVHSLLLRTRSVHRARGEVAHTLRWRPGAAWAIDHAFEPHRTEREQRPVIAARDLGSGQTLEWQSVESTDGPTTERKLRDLLEANPPPLVIKMDNGSGFRDQAVRQLLEERGIIVLYSPARTPSFNGSIEAAIGWLKRWTERSASSRGSAGRWLREDFEFALVLANEWMGPRGVETCSRQEAWESAERVTVAEREKMRESVRRIRAEVEEASHLLRGEESRKRIQEQHDRKAITAALVECGVLEVRRKVIHPPIVTKKLARIP